jgi:anti-anti-sigma factor
MSMYAHLRVKRRESTFVVQFLDHRIAADLAIASLGEELYTVADRPDCQKLILDFSIVDFLSSAMLGKLVALNRRMKTKEGSLVLCGICENIKLIFKLTALDRVLELRDTESDVAEAFGAE